MTKQTASRYIGGDENKSLFGENHSLYYAIAGSEDATAILVVLDDDEESSSESMADSRWHHICALWSNEKGDV